MNKTSQAIKKLIELAPKKATVKRDGKEIIIPTEEVRVGDLVIIKPGEQVGVDGKLLTDEAQIDQSIITGESMRDAILTNRPVGCSGSSEFSVCSGCGCSWS